MIRTRVGFAGGTTENPTQKKMGDHTEVVELDYDPQVVSYPELLEIFWQHHNPNRKRYRDREYISLILYHDEKQKRAAEKAKKEQGKIRGEEVQTEISPYHGFSEAAERQQKWHIKRVPSAMEQLHRLYPKHRQLVDATLTARLNSFAKGYGSLEKLKQEIEKWEMVESSRQEIQQVLQHIKWN